MIRDAEAAKARISANSGKGITPFNFERDQMN